MRINIDEKDIRYIIQILAKNFPGVAIDEILKLFTMETSDGRK